MSGFFGRPTRGGKLTILNCLLWAIVVLGIMNDLPLLTLPEIVAGLPLEFIFPLLDGKDCPFLTSLVIGVNSILWGYGISWLMTLATRRVRGAEDARRGFEVLPAAPIAPPAAGTVDHE